MSKIYTEEELQQAIQDAIEKNEAKHFEEQTGVVLKTIDRRLNEANNYKATIGKDVREVKEEVKDIKTRVISLEEARQNDAKKVREDLQARQDFEDRKRVWWQDWWIRAFGLSTVIWEIVNIYQSASGSLHHIPGIK